MDTSEWTVRPELFTVNVPLQTPFQTVWVVLCGFTATPDPSRLPCYRPGGRPVTMLAWIRAQGCLPMTKDKQASRKTKSTTKVPMVPPDDFEGRRDHFRIICRVFFNVYSKRQRNGRGVTGRVHQLRLGHECHWAFIKYLSVFCLRLQ